MKRLFLLAISTMFLAVGCQKQETEVFPTFYADAETSTDAKTALVGSAIHWEEGDLVKVFGDCGYAQYRVTPEADPTCAMMSYNSVTSGNMFGFLPYRIVYPYSLALDGSGNNNVLRVLLPGVQQSRTGELTKNFPMYAESMVHNVVFKNLCGILRIHLQHSSKNISSIVVRANEALCGTYIIDNSGAAPALIDPTAGANHITLDLGTAQSIAAGKDFYLCMPAGTYTGLTLTIIADDNTACTKSSSAPLTIVRSQISSISIPSSALSFEIQGGPEGALPGLFSVSATKQVHFSQGNLQYTTTGTHFTSDGLNSYGSWRFAEHQYDAIGDGNLSASVNYTGYIDLFGWGSSGFLNNYPYQTSTNDSYYVIGTIDITGTNNDWGVYYAIANGGDQPGIWRTLSNSEWVYLIYTRSYKGRNEMCNGIMR